MRWRRFSRLNPTKCQGQILLRQVRKRSPKPIVLGNANVAGARVDGASVWVEGGGVDQDQQPIQQCSFHLWHHAAKLNPLAWIIHNIVEAALRTVDCAAYHRRCAFRAVPCHRVPVACRTAVPIRSVWILWAGPNSKRGARPVVETDDVITLGVHSCQHNTGEEVTLQGSSSNRGKNGGGEWVTRFGNRSKTNHKQDNISEVVWGLLADLPRSIYASHSQGSRS